MPICKARSGSPGGYAWLLQLSDYFADLTFHARLQDTGERRARACHRPSGARGNYALENWRSHTLIQIIQTPYSWGQAALDNGRDED
jgi:hypothetical protein